MVGSSEDGAENAKAEGDYYIWNGSFECGGYEKMFVWYSPDAFAGGSQKDTYGNQN